VPIGTLEGDIHDIGKNIVVFMLGGIILANGYGIDQARAENVNAIVDFSKEYGVCR